MGITVPDKSAIIAALIRLINQFIFLSFMDRQAKSTSIAKPREMQRNRLMKNQSDADLKLTLMSGDIIAIGRENKASMGNHPPKVCEIS